MADKQADDTAGSEAPVFWRCLAAEFIGTMLLTFVAAGADIMAYLNPGVVNHLERYAAPALLITAMIWSLSGISGAHFNPAVSVAFTLRGVFSAARLPWYAMSQVAGAVAAALLLRALFPGAVVHGITKPSSPFTTLQAFATETALAFLLVLTIVSTAEEKAIVGKNAALAVGGVIALAGLAFSPVSGASMNPARSLGPMIVANDFGFASIYLFAPVAGAVLAVGAAWLLLGSPSSGAAQGAGGSRA